MADNTQFSFDSDSVANAYDNVLAPLLFLPWAKKLLQELESWNDKQVIDLATGTGIVAQQLAQEVGEKGSVIGVDLNPQMLTLAKKRCQTFGDKVKFIESSAYPLALDDIGYDALTCQQGLQFFPEKQEAVNEMFRVLRSGGYALVSTWESMKSCSLFDVLAKALEDTNLPDIAELMRVPFDFMPTEHLKPLFVKAGFTEVNVKSADLILEIPGGINQAIEIVYATPIAPSIMKLPNEKQDEIIERFKALLAELSPDGIQMGNMVSNVVIAKK